MPFATRPAGSQNLASGATSAQSTAVPLGITYARLNASLSCYVAIGANPVAAVGSSMRLAPNWPEVFAVRPGVLIAAIQDGSTAGVVTITWMTS